MHLTIKYSNDLYTFDVDTSLSMNEIYTLVTEHFHLIPGSFQLLLDGRVLDVDAMLNETCACSDSTIMVVVTDIALLLINAGFKSIPSKNGWIIHDSYIRLNGYLEKQDVHLSKSLFEELLQIGGWNEGLCFTMIKRNRVDLLDIILQYIDIECIISYREMYRCTREYDMLDICLENGCHEMAAELIKRGKIVKDTHVV